MSAKDINDLKKSLTAKKVVIGKEETVKNIKHGKIGKVYLSNNVQKDVKNDIERYSKIAKIEFVVLDKSNEELGIICKKPFSISVLSVLNEKK